MANSDDFTGPEGEDALYRLFSIAVATSELSANALPLAFESAAAMHGLPLLKPDRTRVHVINGRTSGGSIRSQRHIHAGMVPQDEMTTINGIRSTILERTAVDIAVRGTFAQGVVVFDGALGKGADRRRMSKMLDVSRRQGIRSARRAFEHADAHSMSVGESWSRAQMIEGGFPTPTLQKGYRVGNKRYDVDFDWNGLLVGEFDGKKKYGRGLLRPGETAADAVFREKQREDDLVSLGLTVRRWTWSVLEKNGLVALLRPWLIRLGLMAG